MQRSWCNSKKKKSTIERTMGLIGETTVVDSIKSIQFRQAFSQAVTLGIIVASALIIWKTLTCIMGSQSPIVVVLSESMEPAFQRGDILFLHMSKDPIRVGEIVVFDVEGRDIPIVHRVIKVHERQDTGEVDVLTKGPDYIVISTSRDTPNLHGDHNRDDDRGLYAPGQLWIQQHHILGRAVGVLTLRWLGDNYHDRKAYYKVYSYWCFGAVCYYIEGLTNKDQVHSTTQKSGLVENSSCHSSLSFVTSPYP
ncbi:unnamed protein product [Camellia sinensis]